MFFSAFSSRPLDPGQFAFTVLQPHCALGWTLGWTRELGASGKMEIYWDARSADNDFDQQIGVLFFNQRTLFFKIDGDLNQHKWWFEPTQMDILTNRNGDFAHKAIWTEGISPPYIALASTLYVVGASNLLNWRLSRCILASSAFTRGCRISFGAAWRFCVLERVSEAVRAWDECLGDFHVQWVNS